jgi:S1-C subfamily serine protease
MSVAGRTTSNPAWIAAGVGLVGVLLGGAAVALGLRQRPEPVTPPALPPASHVASELPAEAPVLPVVSPLPATASLADAVARTRDAVVNLGTSQTLGAGVIVDDSGVVLTNYHVIADALQAPAAHLSMLEARAQRPTVTARFENGRELAAIVLVADREEDLAILRLVSTEEDERFAAVTLGRSGQLRVGQDVYAIGNPFGLSHTVSRGIVSALDRTGLLQNRELPLIQLDASINVGNSGGPLFSLDGHLMGLITAKRQQAEGIAFAVPVDHIRGFLRAVTDDRSRRSGAIGVEVDPTAELDPGAIAKGYRAGLTLIDVEEGSPAAAAGLRADDTIVELRGKRLDGLPQASDPVMLAGHLVATVRSMFEGEQLPVAVVRDGAVLALSVEIGAASPSRQAVIDAEELLGLQLDPDASAPVVIAVGPASPLSGIAQTLDRARIVGIVDQDIESLDDLAEPLAQIRSVVRQKQRGVRVLVEFRTADGEALPPMHIPIR